jgi:hypothetical protein
MYYSTLNQLVAVIFRTQETKLKLIRVVLLAFKIVSDRNITGKYTGIVEGKIRCWPSYKIDVSQPP